MKRVTNYIKENGIKLSPLSKAAKLIANGNDAAATIAMQTTKIYKEDATLRKLCEEVMFKLATEQEKEIKKPERCSASNRGGEPRGRY